MYWNTVTPMLQKVLRNAMEMDIFQPFRLVGGTSLSLQIGHRMSVDIDLFTDAEYDSINFELINGYFQEQYPLVYTNEGLPVAFGKSWYVGDANDNLVKVDMYYTDSFIRPAIIVDEIRMASIEDVIGMKLEIIGQGARKKDFWDLHALHARYSIQEMINFHQERSPYTYTQQELRGAFTNFEKAENDLDPVCLLGKAWPLIKLDFVEWLNKIE